MRLWIDIDNPPQVQYLLPFRNVFESAGAETVITARDYGGNVEMLRRSGVDPYVFGTRVGRGKLRKASAVAVRARELAELFMRTGRPDAVVAASRAAALAAWRLRIPSFLVGDYEHVHVSVYRVTGSTLFYPNVVDPAVFKRRGLRGRQLIAYEGVKEDLTFAGVDLDAVEPHDLGPAPEGAVRVLFRPPAETSHYYKAASTDLARATLEHLARAGALVVFSPRQHSQIRLLEGLPFQHAPLVLTDPVPFVPLLKSVDMVICSGGTMLREGAYLGIPAYSIFQSKIGAVDRWLEQIGRATVLTGRADLTKIQLKPRGPLTRLNSNPRLLWEIAEFITAEISRRQGQRTGSRRIESQLEAA